MEEFRAAAVRALDADDIASFEEALTLYPGELLPEDRNEGWVVGERSDLQVEQLRLLLGLARASIAAASPPPRSRRCSGSSRPIRCTRRLTAS